MISIERSELYLDDFPAVSICNLNPFDTSDPEVLDHLNQTLLRNNLTALINATDQSPAIYKVRQSMKLLKANFISDIRKDKLMYPNDTFKFVYTFNKMVLSCFFNEKKCDADDFDYFFNFDYAHCLTFNKKNENNLLKKTSKTGPGSGLSLELFAGYPGQQDFLMEKRGFYLAVHNNSILPLINFEGIKLSVGQMTEIGIKRTYFNKLGQPYSKCRKNTKITKDDSEFYKISLKYGGYNRKACIEVCLQNKFIIPRCNCSDPQIKTYDLEANLCKSYEQMICIDKVRDKFDTDDLSLICSEHCPENCDTIDYEYLISHSDYPSEYYYNLVKMQNNVKEKFNKYGQLNYSLFKQSSLMLNVFYQDLSTTVIKESKTTTLPDLISKIGIKFSIISFKGWV